jgi:hypothetical protein
MNGIKMCGRLASAALRCAVLAALMAVVGNVSAERVGKFMYRGQPENLNGDTIHVSDTMAALAELFWAKGMDTTISVDTITCGDTPSVFFVIDNSGSMSGASGHDANGLRFSLASSCIDSVQSKYPHAEVGLAVFGTYLYFNLADRPYFAVCPTQLHGAYIPLLRLDSVYAAYGNQTGYQILKSILAVSAYDTGVNQYVGLTYQPTDTVLRGKGANITAGFEAAKSAMASAKASPCSRYIIFLSDGEANAPGGDETWYFRDSVKNVPTTFTIFFPGSATLATSWGLREIDTMTHNIRGNGYDPSHPTIGDTTGCNGISNYWSCNSPYVLSIPFPPIWKLFTVMNGGTPMQIVINHGCPITIRTGDSAFFVGGLIPLHGTLDSINVVITYQLLRNHVPAGTQNDTVKYWIRRDTSSGVWAPSRDSFDVWTWDRDLNFRYNNQVITAIDSTMDSVELYFTFDSGNAKYGYDIVQVDLYNKLYFTMGSYPIDHEHLMLARVGNSNAFSAKFKREVSPTATQGDGVLQYQGNNDSIIAVFRNRESTPLPLDTLRIAIPLRRPSGVAYDNKALLRTEETWSVFSDNGLVRIRLSSQEMYAIKIYSLAGHLVDSRTVSQNNVSFRLPNGAYIVAVKPAGSPRETRKKVVAVGR